MSRIAPIATACLLALLAGTDRPAGAGEGPRPIDFNRDVRPILSDTCYACHGPDKNQRKADLRLDTKDGLFAAAVVPGKPEEGELLGRITSDDPEEKMPPPGSGKSLSPAQVDIFRRWIAEGAEYKGHWSFLKPARAIAPDVDLGHFVRNPIDRFLLARMREAGLSPSAEADRATLIRRLSFDLTGLPPSRAEVRAFEEDAAGDAYEKLVDRLLTSPSYGERMAMMWLDLVRYADSIGYHSDNSRNTWPYRDYVVSAFNANLPFDRFTVEQLAGDLLPEPTQAQKVASGYNRLLQTTEEGGAQAKEYAAKYAADRVRNASTVWLGLTMGCAECHDHKFDPIPTRDFYRFAAFFADVQEPIVGSREPGMPVADPAQAAKVGEFDRIVVDRKAALLASSHERASAQAEWEAGHGEDPSWTVLEPESAGVEGESSLRKEPGGVLKSFGKVAATETLVISAKTDLAGITGFKLEALDDVELPSGGPGTAPGGGFALTEFKVTIATEGEKADPLPLAFLAAVSDGGDDGHDAARAIDGQDGTSWAIRRGLGRPHAAVFEAIAPAGGPKPSRLVFRLEFQSKSPQRNLGKLRISATTTPDPSGRWVPPAVRAALAVPTDRRDPAASAEVAAYFRSASPLFAADRAAIDDIFAARSGFVATLPTSLVTETGPARTICILPRGNWMSDAGAEVEPGVPSFLPPIGRTQGRADRMDLARWIVSPDNPLPARVFVNRAWKMAFGQGLAKGLDDLGSQGEWPTHPELLDWLAVEFRESGWDVKRLMRLVVTSGAYRQSIHAPAEARDRDPYNRLVARQTPFRLDAEMVRDNALAISGLLAAEPGGPPVRPYQPAGYWDALNFPARTWQADGGPSQYRRGLYTHWQRTFLHPSLLAFDAPSREECTAERTRSNIPQQALVLLNDPTYVEASRAFAERIMAEGGADAQGRIVWAFREALSRRPTSDEVRILAEMVARQQEQYRADPEAAKKFLAVGLRPVPAGLEPAELAAWTSAARVVLNLHEAITRP